MERPPDTFFPTFDKLRDVMGELRLPTLMPFDKEIDLLGQEPTVTAQAAAAIGYSRMLVREEWAEVVEISASTFDAIDTLAPRTPRMDDPRRFEKREYRYRSHDARRQRCTYCGVQKGYMHCYACSGSGRATDLEDGRVVEVPCSKCRGGYVTCTHCDGSGESVVVEVHQGTDSPIEARYVAVPSLVGDLDDKVGERIKTFATIPDTFRIDLEPSVAMSAYRGATGVTHTNFFDYGFLDAKDRARAMMPPSPENVVLREDAFWAWPFLCVRWTINGKDIDVGILSDLEGNWSAVFGGPPLHVNP